MARPFGRRRRSESEAVLARPSDRRGGPESEVSTIPPQPGLPVGEAGQSRMRASSLLGQAFRSERLAGVRGDGSERCFLLGQAFRSERRAVVESERRSSLARPFGQRLDRPSGLSLGFWAGSGVARCSRRRLLDRAFAGKPVHEGPRVYEPDMYYFFSRDSMV